MKNLTCIFKIEMVLVFIINTVSFAQNPLIRDQFTADPSARVFGDKVYIFPSHDILAAEGKGRKDWFCMEDYHVFSSADLTHWTDHGMIVQQNSVPWIKPNSYSMWAPDCIERKGKYYFYFPSIPKDTINYKKGFTVGVAIASKPEGPYVPEPNPIKGISGIDPNVFIDKDGQAYLYWSGGNIYGAKLKENMTELDSEVKTLENLPAKGLKEGPYVFERNGIYYLTYPHVENKIERLEYATADNPLGPFKFAGVIMDESPTGCWTNHHSIIEFKKQWYLFYHHNDLLPQFDKARSIRADYLNFNPDGTIQKVIPTLRGVGITEATDQIQIDRYSEISDKRVSISFLDSQNSFKGWKTAFNQSGGWIQYNNVDFGQKKLKSVTVKVSSEKGGVLQIASKEKKQTIIAEVTVSKGSNWAEIKSPVLTMESGIQNLIVLSKGDNQIEIDWIKFE
ncbi:family 43 glycosylhydrolase [Flavobacterium sp. HJJ]|uniref:family 43 glycosylhydrolase n=1 Tax=Flavobacterium sp. HJJ TaxID=2783792 RepID=UPI00188CAE50|nr:family 43 glycosylhydrolase [Flavobacterium sp. HJJ]MBF4470560.1 family 43 glycosylhydrolase [Flavobacterium sp. HJJ]